MTNIKIDLQLLKNFGLSLNTNKKYFILYEPFCWSLIGVYDNIEDAVNNCWDGCTLNKYYEICANAGYDHRGVKFDENYLGHNYHFCKGFFQNINMWELLEILCCDIKEDVHDNGIDISAEIISNSIDSKLKSNYMEN